MKSQTIYSGGTAKALAATTGWTVSNDPNTPVYEPSTNNASGFSALPAGYYYGYNNYYVGSDAVFWSATESNASNADYWYVYASRAYLSSNYYKYYGYSVRCLQD